MCSQEDDPTQHDKPTPTLVETIHDALAVTQGCRHPRFDKATCEVIAQVLTPLMADDIRLAMKIGAGNPVPEHTVHGKTSVDGWPYGTTHDMDCPGCIASGSSFTASPRSETYWSS